MTGQAFDLVVQGGTVVTAGCEMRADIGIRDGRIVALADRLDGSSEVFDASGLLVLPGGIDSHVHVEQRGNAQGPDIEDFTTATTSAACGGTTAIIAFARQVKGEGIRESVEDYQRRATKAVIDVAFHMTITDPTEAVLATELPDLIQQGHRSIKIFMTTHRSRVDDEGILRLLDLARHHGALVTVHAENYAATEWLTAALQAAGRSGPQHNAHSKPVQVEREAVHRIIAFAEIIGTPIQIFHVTSEDALEEIRRAQVRGVPVFAETCPQYLCFTQDDLDRDDEDAVRFIFGPPPRTIADQESLWRAMAIGTIGVVSSDHAPHNLHGTGGKIAGMRQGGFATTPHGVPGLETRLPILFSEGVNKGRIDLQRFVELTATAPARLFGLAPRKGAIAIGADADLAIWDPDKPWTIRNSDLHHRVDYSPYEGMEGRGAPVATISRGDIIWRDGTFTGEPGRGRLLLRPSYSLPGTGLAAKFAAPENKLKARI